MEATPSEPGAGGVGYTWAFFVGAGLATLLFPLVAVITALVMLGGQTDPRKRTTLKSWAWFSTVWLVVVVVVLIAVAVGAFGSSSDKSGPCVGGPKPGATGKSVPGSSKKFVFPCSISGTVTVKLGSQQAGD